MGIWYDCALIHGVLHIWWTDPETNEKHHIMLNERHSALVQELLSDCDYRMQRTLAGAVKEAGSVAP